MAKETATRKADVGKAYQLLPVIGPSAGIDLRSAPTLIEPERAKALVNFSLAEPGALVVRSGYLGFSTTSLGAGAAQGGARVYLNTAVPNPASTLFTLIGWNGGIYQQTDSGGWSGPSLTGISTGDLGFTSDRDLVAVFDGISTASYKSTNGSSWTRFGIARAGFIGPTGSTTGGNMSSGEYEFNYTFKDRDLATESNGSSSPSTVTLNNAGTTLFMVMGNSLDPQVDAIVVYGRKKSAGETVLRKISSLAQSTGAGSTLVISDTNWTTNDEIPTDHDLPPVLSFGVVWKNRWWARSATVTNRIHFTQLFQPQSWPALFYIDIPFERGDAIQALVPLGDTLLIFGSTKVFVIIGQTSLDFEVRPTIGSQDGALGPRSVAAIENGIVHAAASGIYIFDGSTDKLLSYDIDPGWRDLIGNTAATALARVAVTYHQKNKELRIAVPRRYPSGASGEWVMDLNRTRTSGVPAWTSTDRAIGGYISWDGPETAAGNRGRLLSWDATTGRLFEEATGTSANSSNLTAEYEGPGLTLGAFRARWIDLRLEYEPHSGSYAIEPLVDGVTFGSQSVPISGGFASYGSAVYGVSAYGGVGRRQAYRILPLEADGRTFVLKMVYSGQEPFRLYSYHVGLVPETRSRSFSE